MAFAHCPECGWSQDDFWSEDYNPIERLRFWEKQLLDTGLDTTWDGDRSMTYREIIASKVRAAADDIESMEWKTRQDAIDDGEACPECGERVRID